MMSFLSSLLSRNEPVLSEAGPRDAAAVATLHAKSFQRGWSEEEVEALLIERSVLAHRALAGNRLAGFIMSRIAADEAEILSVAVDRAFQGRGLGCRLLMLHLGRLAGHGTRAVFLEVGESNDSAGKLYARAGFREISRRSNYYGSATALVLRRDLVAPAMDSSPGGSI